MRKILIWILSLFGFAGSAAAPVPVSGSDQAQKIPAPVDRVPVQPVQPVPDKSVKIGPRRIGTDGEYMNQRQYRKYCRQNPCLLRSKKLRSKN